MPTTTPARNAKTKDDSTWRESPKKLLTRSQTIGEVVSEVVAEVEEEVEEVEGVGGTSRKALLVLPVSTSTATVCKQAQLVKAHGNSITEK